MFKFDISLLWEEAKSFVRTARLRFAHDLKRENQEPVERKIDESANVSLNFLLLLTGASFVCTLGLLSNSTAVVIGGMIISPIMWPLMKISFGISHEKVFYIRQALVLLVISVMVGLLSSVLITLVSPLKSLNSEILARTNPNLIDVIVALVAGFVAAIAISKPKIGESLAGVAIATSLMPPLCVSGIGIALLDKNLAFSGFFLFLENAVAIVFVSTIVFTRLLYNSGHFVAFRKKGLLIVGALLVAVSIPSLIFLFQYSAKIKTYAQIQSILNRDFREISSAIKLGPPKVNQIGGGIKVEVEALVPEGVAVSYLDQNKMITDMREAIGQKISLAIILQRVLPVLDQDKFDAQSKIGRAREKFLALISRIDTSLALDSFDVSASAGILNVAAILRGSSNVVFTEREREEIERGLTEHLSQPVRLNIEVIERKSLFAEPEFEEMSIRQRAFQLMSVADEQSEIRDVSIKKLIAGTSATSSRYELNFDLRQISGHVPTFGSLNFVRQQLEKEFDAKFSLNLVVIKGYKIPF